VTVRERNNVRTSGRADTAMLFAHGFGCDQDMWRFVAPAFEDRYRVVLFDHGARGTGFVIRLPAMTAPAGE
jgi:sigma-B regulation protein RsbQ